MTAIAASTLMLSMAACTTPGERAAGGAVLGGVTGAAVGGAATGRTSGALAGAAVGASTAPRSPCPYGTYRDASGNLFCR
jgi:surface antigen